MKNPKCFQYGGLVLLLMLIGLGSVDAALDLPNTPYFERIGEMYYWVNQFRTEVDTLNNYTDFQFTLRAMMEPINGLPAQTYTCWDKQEDILARKLSSQCTRLGQFRRGQLSLGLDKLYFSTIRDQQLHDKKIRPLEWSDELAYASQIYALMLSGCNIYEPNIWQDSREYSVEYILEEYATWKESKRMVFYPERMDWQDPKEAVWDWIVNEKNEKLASEHFLEDQWTHIGIACACHGAFGQVCVVHFAEDLLPIIEEDFDDELEGDEWIMQNQVEAMLFNQSTIDKSLYKEEEFMQQVLGRFANQEYENRDRHLYTQFSYDMPEWFPEGFVLPNWWDVDQQDLEWIYDHLHDPFKSKLISLMLPNDPACINMETSNSYFNEHDEFDNFAEFCDFEDPTNATQMFTGKDMHYLAEEFYWEVVDEFRNRPGNWLVNRTVIDSTKRIGERFFGIDIGDSWADDDLDDYDVNWNEGLARAARHVANDEGACGTSGDAYGRTVEEVAKRYYVHNPNNLKVYRFESEFLINPDNFVDSPRYMLEYFVNQIDCFDLDFLYDEDDFDMGVGCACAQEQRPGKPRYLCYVVTAESGTKPVQVSQFIPEYQEIVWYDEVCLDKCHHYGLQTAIQGVEEEFYTLCSPNMVMGADDKCYECEELNRHCSICSDAQVYEVRAWDQQLENGRWDSTFNSSQTISAGSCYNKSFSFTGVNVDDEPTSWQVDLFVEAYSR